MKNHRTKRIRRKCRYALAEIGVASTWPAINDWLWENSRRWVKIAPTAGQVGSIFAGDREIVKVGRERRLSVCGSNSNYTLWGLREWA